MAAPDSYLDAGAARIERERRAAERRYNEAITAFDASVGIVPDGLPAPAALDGAELAALNAGWDTAGGGTSRGMAGAVRRLLAPILRLVLGPQRTFNAALVAELNRRDAVHRAELTALRDYADRLARFQSNALWYAQAVAAFVDTRAGARSGERNVAVLNEAVNALADDWLKRWESLAAREARYDARHRDLAGVYDELRDMVAIAQQSAVALKREVERLTLRGVPAAPGATPAAASADVVAALESFKYVGFEDRFRGSPEVIRERLSSYLPLFEGRSQVVELGCGRGEFLELLREHGIPGRGVDANHEMVEVTRARGLYADEGDALEFLARLPDESVGGVFAAQVVEHLEPAYLMRLVETAVHKLQRGGLLVLETINPACWTAFFESYLRDLTHVRPLHPETLQYLLRASGFQDVTVEYRSPVPPEHRLQGVQQPPRDADPALVNLADAFNANMDRLNSRLFTHQDYAVVGRK